MNTKYGSFSSTQIEQVKSSIQKSIFFLLLYEDPKTSNDYSNIDVAEAFRSLQYKLSGLNSILFEPLEIVEVMSLLESAYLEYVKQDFDFKRYRKLILDAGARIMHMEEHNSVEDGG